MPKPAPPTFQPRLPDPPAAVPVAISRPSAVIDAPPPSRYQNFVASYFPTFAGLGLAIGSSLSTARETVSRALRSAPASSGTLGPRPYTKSRASGSPRNAAGQSPATLPLSGNLPPDGTNTFVGSTTTGSPSIATYTRLTETQERREGIANDWQLFMADPRYGAALEMLASAAVADGYTLVVEGVPGTGRRVVSQAKQEINAMLLRTGLHRPDGRPNKTRFKELLLPAPLEGDLFVQNVVDTRSDDIMDLVYMPAASMERLSDNADQFPDPQNAYAQFDTVTQVAAATFAEWQITHLRWNRIGGDRYGQPWFRQARGHARSLRLAEDALNVRTVSNAARIKTVKVGSPEGDGGDDEDIQKFKEDNGLDGNTSQRASDPYAQNDLLIGNAFVEYGTLPADPNIHEVGHIRLMREDVTLALHAPLHLKGYNTSELSRDELTEILKEWLKTVAYAEEFIYGLVYAAIELQLRLKHINPKSLRITLAGVEKTTDTFSDVVGVINKMCSNTIGAGLHASPMPLATRQQIATLLRPWMKIDDVEHWHSDLLEQSEEHHADPETVRQDKLDGIKGGGVQNGAANPKNAPGGATTGYGATNSSHTPAPGENYKKVVK